jgi:DHA2 family multidrug resistance protein
MARNTGGSIGVSIGQNVLAYRQQFHQSRLVENVVPSNPAYQETLRQVTEYFQAQGSNAAQAGEQAVAMIGQMVQQQAAYLAYIDVFYALCLMGLAVAPLALLLRSTKPVQGQAAH